MLQETTDVWQSVFNQKFPAIVADMTNIMARIQKPVLLQLHMTELTGSTDINMLSLFLRGGRRRWDLGEMRATQFHGQTQWITPAFCGCLPDSLCWDPTTSVSSAIEAGQIQEPASVP